MWRGDLEPLNLLLTFKSVLVSESLERKPQAPGLKVAERSVMDVDRRLTKGPENRLSDENEA